MLAKGTKLVSIYYGNMSAEEILKQEYPLVYSFNRDTKLINVSKILNITTALLHPTESYLIIRFDSGLEVHCTRDQEFYTFRARIVKAEDIQPGESIRAFSMSLAKDGHYRVHGWVNDKPKHQYVARLVWNYFFGQIEDNLILHHKDFDKVNNDIRNLELLTNSFHNVVHYPMRRDGGFHHGNHKVISVTYTFEPEEMISIELDNNNSVVIADNIPVAGTNSGIIVLV